jgi:hypothetical protein
MNAQQLLDTLLSLQAQGANLQMLDVMTLQSRTDEDYNSWMEESWPGNVEVNGSELRIY